MIEQTVTTPEVQQHQPLETRSRAEGDGFHALDPRVIGLWRWTNLIGFGVALIAQLIAVLLIPEAARRLWLTLSLWALFALICGVIGWRRPARAYRAWAYRIDDKVLEIRNGLLFRHTRLLPLSRMQHVDIDRGPLERQFGLASLTLHTAGTHASSVRIPGLDADEAIRLRDHLIEIGGDDGV
jgi:uncharacterized protein